MATEKRYSVRPVSFGDTGAVMDIWEPDRVDENGELIVGAWRNVNYYLEMYPGRIVQVIHNPDSIKRSRHMVLIESVDEAQS